MAWTTPRRAPMLVVRMVITMLLLVLLYVAALVAVVLLMLSVRDDSGGRPLLWSIPLGALVVAGVVVVQRLAARWALLRAVRASPIGPDEAAELHGVVDRLCALGDIDKPRIMVGRVDLPNAFVTGDVLCVTEGLLELLSREELEAVIAHELSHLTHRDGMVVESAASIGLAFEAVIRIVYRVADDAEKRQRDGKLPKKVADDVAREDARFDRWMLWWLIWPLLLFCRAVYVISSLLVRMLSRERELAADISAARLTGRPSVLAAALTKLSDEMGRVPTRDLRTAAPYDALLCVEMPGAKGWTARLASAHPPLDKRLDRLARLSGRLGKES